MNDKHSKYLMIDAKKITRSVWKYAGREMIGNDFLHYEKQDAITNADIVFEENGVKEEFRKVILRLNPITVGVHSNLFKENSNIYEYLTDGAFRAKIVRDTSEKEISGYRRHQASLFVSYDNYQNTFKTDYNLTNYKEILEFFKKLKDDNCIESYVKSIVEILDLDDQIRMCSKVKDEFEKKLELLKVFKESSNN